MKCTVCQRELAPNLSLCVRCGAMVNDSVREELEMSITPIAAASRPRVPAPAVKQPETEPQPPSMPESKPAKSTQTVDLVSKKTSPTLAEFKTRNAVVPDWRIALQNSVRQRTGRGAADAISTNAVAAAGPARAAAAALRIQHEPEPANAADLKVTNALKRIEQSRRTYLPSEKAREGIRVARAAAASRNFPFNVVARTAETPERPAAAEAKPVVKPRLVSSMRIEKKKYDTNKLAPLPEAAYMASDREIVKVDTAADVDLETIGSQKIEFAKSERVEETLAIESADLVEFDDVEEAEISAETEPETEEIDDLAPLSMRFNAGLFDLIIGGVASLVLFSPFIGFYDGWASLTGLLLFSAILMVVMFLYLTASVSLLGHTFGMKLFSLELIDAEQNEFPTIHQAAVNASVYLLSLVFGGLGFVPLLFNEEKRAAHDLVSGTILVRA